MGALVTLNLPDDSPLQDLPWIITVGPLDDAEEWEPVVCGPYLRNHALSLAGAVVADQSLMAVVEPLVPHVSAEQIRDEVDRAKALVESAPPDYDGDDEGDGEADEIGPADGYDAGPPTEEEVRAGFARIAARLTAGQ